MTLMKFTKVSLGLVAPADVETEQALEKLHVGDLIHGDFKKARNYAFHKKFFALLKVGYEAWEVGEGRRSNKHGPIEKNYERFRADVTILAGYYTQHFRLDGSVIVEAKSISFANMGEEEFAQVYSKVADVLLQKVLRNYTREDLDEVVDKILGMV